MWFKEIVKFFKYTIQAFLSMKVNIYMVQQGPAQKIPSYQAINLFKSLLHNWKLTDAQLRNASCLRKDYIKQQAGLEEFFSK